MKVRKKKILSISVTILSLIFGTNNGMLNGGYISVSAQEMTAVEFEELDQISTDSDAVEAEPQIAPSFTYDPQPESMEDVQEAIDTYSETQEKPKWEYQVDDDIIPSGWRCDSVEDPDTGIEYWTIFPKIQMRSDVTSVSNESELCAAIANSSIKTIIITKDIELNQALTIKRDLTFISAGDTSVITSVSGKRHITVPSGKNTFSLTFEDVILDGGNKGGGISSTSGANITLIGAVIQNCDNSNGGGISISSGTLTLDSSKISNNNASVGGGIYANNSKVTITNGSIVNNNTAELAGGIYVNALTFNSIASLSVGDGEISGNDAKNGGGVYLFGGQMSIQDNASISNNTASEDGGGIYGVSASVIGMFSCDLVINMEGGTISDNSASGNGGGIYALGASEAVTEVNIDNGEISSNSAVDGGGIYAIGKKGSLEIIISGTIDSNNASGNGGGIYVEDGMDSTCTYEILTVTSTATFSDNMASRLATTVSTQDQGIHEDNVSVASNSGDTEYLYNNYDVNYTNYEVIFDTNGGSEVSPVTGILPQDLALISKPSDPTKVGSTFAGWYMDNGTAWDFDNDTVSSDVTLYAKWIADTYKIVFYDEDGTQLDSISVNHGDSIPLPAANPTKADTSDYTYSFDEWVPSGNYTTSSLATEDMIFTAVYTETAISDESGSEDENGSDDGSSTVSDDGSDNGSGTVNDDGSDNGSSTVSGDGSDNGSSTVSGDESNNESSTEGDDESNNENSTVSDDESNNESSTESNSRIYNGSSRNSGSSSTETSNVLLSNIDEDSIPLGNITANQNSETIGSIILDDEGVPLGMLTEGQQTAISFAPQTGDNAYVDIASLGCLAALLTLILSRRKKTA